MTEPSPGELRFQWSLAFGASLVGAMLAWTVSWWCSTHGLPLFAGAAMIVFAGFWLTGLVSCIAMALAVSRARNARKRASESRVPVDGIR